MYNNTQDNLSLHKQTNQDIGKHTHQNVGAKWTWKHIHCPSRWRRVGNRLLALLVLFWLHQPPLGLTAAAAGRFSCPFADLRDLAVLPRLPPLSFSDTGSLAAGGSGSSSDDGSSNASSQPTCWPWPWPWQTAIQVESSVDVIEDITTPGCCQPHLLLMMKLLSSNAIETTGHS